MKTILLQLDTDPLPSSFDRVVAVDAGVDEVFSYGGVTPETVEPLVHGAMFTRGPDQLRHTAIFVGGSDVSQGERLVERVRQTFFGPIRVSVMMDSNGSNTTAAAAVRTAASQLDLKQTRALVLGGTGPVGHRAAQLLALEGAQVRLASRSRERAQATCDAIAQHGGHLNLTPIQVDSADSAHAACHGTQLVIAAGAAGVQFLKEDEWSAVDSLRVAIDLNAVPPAGLGGIQVTDKAVQRGDCLCYGAIGVGGLKMKIHKAALERLFTANDQVLDTESIYAIGQDLL